MAGPQATSANHYRARTNLPRTCSRSDRLAGRIKKVGNSCPLGWFSSGSTCIKSR